MLWGCFEIGARSNLENIQKTYTVQFHFNAIHGYSLKPTIRLKTSLETLFWECFWEIEIEFRRCLSERKGCSKFSKLPKKWQSCLCCYETTDLQSRISGFSKNNLREKCFLWVFWKGWKFARKRSVIKSFD